MISEKSLHLSQLITMVRNAVVLHCTREKVPQISVVGVAPNAVKPGTYVAFDFVRIAFLVPSNLPQKLIALTPYERVWLLNSAVVHEIHHYKQYLKMRNKGAKVTEDKFDEEEARVEGKLHADNMMKHYTPEVINPLLLPEMTSNPGIPGVLMLIQNPKGQRSCKGTGTRDYTRSWSTLGKRRMATCKWCYRTVYLTKDGRLFDHTQGDSPDYKNPKKGKRNPKKGISLAPFVFAGLVTLGVWYFFIRNKDKELTLVEHVDH